MNTIIIWTSIVYVGLLCFSGIKIYELYITRKSTNIALNDKTSQIQIQRTNMKATIDEMNELRPHLEKLENKLRGGI